MPYNNPYNQSIANKMNALNERFAHLYAYSPVDGRGNPFALEGGSSAGVLFQIGNASKRDAEDNIVNNNMNLPSTYYYGNDAEDGGDLKGGSGFAQGTFRDRGDGSQLGASPVVGVFQKGSGISGGHRHGDFAESDHQEYRGGHRHGDFAESDHQEYRGGSHFDKMLEDVVKAKSMKGGAKKLGEMMMRVAKEQHMKGGSFWDDFKSGFNTVFEPASKYILKPLAMATGNPLAVAGLTALGYGTPSGGADPSGVGVREVGGAILGNPDPYPVKGNSERLAGRGRGRPKKAIVGDKQHDLLAMPAPVALSNGVPPTAQLRGSYGGSKPSKAKEAVMKAVSKKLGCAVPSDTDDKSMSTRPVKVKPAVMPKDFDKVGSGDGRKKRAEIVKRIMKEKGLKMIDASRYVREHNLYKKD